MRSHENFELNKSYLNYLYCQFQYTILVWSYIGYNLFNLYNYSMCTVHILYCMMYVLVSLSAYLWFLNSAEHFTIKYFLRCKTSGRLKSSSDDRLCARHCACCFVISGDITTVPSHHCNPLPAYLLKHSSVWIYLPGLSVQTLSQWQPLEPTLAGDLSSQCTAVWCVALAHGPSHLSVGD